METKTTFSLSYRQLLKNDGTIDDELPKYLNDELLLSLYHTMFLIRSFDKKAVSLQRTGQLGTYPSCLGQEDVYVAIGRAMQKDDIYVASYRDPGVLLQRGVSMTQILQYWGGDEMANVYHPGSRDYPPCVPVGTQNHHAVGAATALRIKKENQAVLVTGGDGSTSKGDFLEALNLAGVWKLPVVFVVNNNQWAISVSRKLQCGAGTLAQKAIGAGIEGIQVDGNDVLGMYETVAVALNKARQGRGPTLIEALTYRLGDHTTADDATRYRASEELNKAWGDEPLKRLRTYLHNADLWDEGKEKELIQSCDEEIKCNVAEYLKISPQPPEAMFDYLYERLPKHIIEQRNELLVKQFLNKHKEG